MLNQYNTHFLLALEREELGVSEQSPFVGAVYSPGSACTRCAAVTRVLSIIEEHKECYIFACDFCAMGRWQINTDDCGVGKCWLTKVCCQLNVFDTPI